MMHLFELLKKLLRIYKAKNKLLWRILCNAKRFGEVFVLDETLEYK